MNNYAMSALSLQTRLTSLRPQPASVAVDPKGFKAALESFIQFLISHDVSATLWLKLPKDDAWWNDIWQYAQQAVGCTIYILGEPAGNSPDTLAASLRPIPVDWSVDPSGMLKREYLCLAVADNFMGSLLAARTLTSAPTSDKRNLQLYCTTAVRTMRALAAGIKDIIESTLSEDPAGDLGGDEQSIAAAAALSQWGRSFPDNVLSNHVLPLSEAFLTWQIQFQEDLRSQLTESQNAPAESENALASSDISSGFLGKASQELQAPLTTIKTALTLLGSPALKLSQRQRYLEMISSQCEHQEALIKGIVKLLQIQTTKSGTAQPIKLSDLIPGIVSTYQPIAEERGVMLAYTVPNHLERVSGVKAEIKQIVIQLINNGIQMTPKGGRVWVSATAEGDRFIALTVEDSGYGVAKVEVNRLFEAFYQVAGSSDGTGLGLTLVHQLVQRMGGSITVDSTPNQGTRFKILLPIYPAAETQSDSADLSAAQSANAGETAASFSPRQLSRESAERESAERESAENSAHGWSGSSHPVHREAVPAR